MHCTCYSNTRGVTTLPLQEFSSRDLQRKRDSSENNEWLLNHFLVFSGMKVGVITFLIPRSGSCLVGENLQSKMNFMVGSALMTTAR
jgi:hypothetical protein